MLTKWILWTLILLDSLHYFADNRGMSNEAKDGPKYCVAVITARAKKPQFFGFDGRRDAQDFFIKAIAHGCQAWFYEQINIVIKKGPRNPKISRPKSQ